MSYFPLPDPNSLEVFLALSPRLVDIPSVFIAIAQKYSKTAAVSDAAARLLLGRLQEHQGLETPFNARDLVAALCRADHAQDLTADGMVLMEQLLDKAKAAQPLANTGISSIPEARTTEAPAPQGEESLPAKKSNRGRKKYDDIAMTRYPDIRRFVAINLMAGKSEFETVALVEEKYEYSGEIPQGKEQVRNIVRNCIRWFNNHPNWYDSEAPQNGQNMGKI